MFKYSIAIDELENSLSLSREELELNKNSTIKANTNLQTLWDKRRLLESNIKGFVEAIKALKNL